MLSSSDDIIRALRLAPHPEGGHFAETWRQGADGGRGAMTAIYYLLKAGERSAWHRVTDADEIWHWYAGAPLILDISANGNGKTSHQLGPDIANGQRPQIVIPAGHWQAAESMGDWTLAGCTVGPGFIFDSFEMAPEGWQPDNSNIRSARDAGDHYSGR